MTDDQSPFATLGLPDPAEQPDQPSKGPTARRFAIILTAVSTTVIAVGALIIGFVKPNPGIHYAQPPATPNILAIVDTGDLSATLTVAVPAYAESITLTCTPEEGEKVSVLVPAAPDAEATRQAGQAARTIIASPLTAATTYECDAIAREADYRSGVSEAVTVTTAEARLIPAIPEKFSHQLRAGKTYLSWSDSSGATQYWVQRATNPDFTTDVIAETVTTPNFTDTVKAGTTYYYRVSARNGSSASAVSPVPYVVAIPAPTPNVAPKPSSTPDPTATPSQ